MPITTLTEVRELLQVGAELNDVISMLIPKVQDFVVNRVNSFANPKVYLQSTTISFDPQTKTISDSDSKFVENYFTSNIDFMVMGSLFNDGVYSIAFNGCSAGSLTTNENLVAKEAAREYVLIQAINFPKDISMAAAEFIAHKLDKDRMKKSFSIGSYSEQKLDQSELMEIFSPWRDIMAGM